METLDAYTKKLLRDCYLKSALDNVEGRIVRSASRPQRCISGIAVSSADKLDGVSVIANGLNFELPLPLLWGHDLGAPIGKVVGLTVCGDELRFEALLCNGDSKASSSIADQVWAGLCEKQMHGVSVRWRDARMTSDGVLVKATLEELSVVAPWGADHMARVCRIWEHANVSYMDNRPRDTVIWSET
jgi:hypothetical protein